MRSLDEVKAKILDFRARAQAAHGEASRDWYLSFITGVRWSFVEELADWDPDKEREK